MNDRDLLKRLENAGWQHIRTTGSHMHFKHPTKPGLVTVPSGGKCLTTFHPEHCARFFDRLG